MKSYNTMRGSRAMRINRKGGAPCRPSFPNHWYARYSRHKRPDLRVGPVTLPDTDFSDPLNLAARDSVNASADGELSDATAAAATIRYGEAEGGGQFAAGGRQ